MPNRIIREGWLESEPINGLSKDAELFFLRLCLKADDYGRYHGNPILLKSSLYPLKESIRSTDMPRWLAECEKAGLVRCYQHSDKKFVEIVKFMQRTRTDSKFPSPENGQILPVGQMSDNCQQSAALGEGGGGVVCGGDSRAKQSPQHHVSDENWRGELQKSDAYGMLSVEAEFQKMIFWCQQKRKQPSRSRFLAWLNRADKPMTTGGGASIAPTPAEEIRRLEDEFRAASDDITREKIRRKITVMKGKP
jgi:hypothetical protein